MHPFSQFLVDSLQATPLFEGRYEKLAHLKGSKGCFSVIFKAYDKLNGKHVAIKFYDPAKFADPYRLIAFKREEEILRVLLLNRNRCLQLVEGMKKYTMNFPVGGGVTAPIECPFFVVEWLDVEIEDVFDAQEKHDALTKLKLFHDIVLAVEALHRHDIFHRDMKPDNLRADGKTEARKVLAIDMGTAARFDSLPLTGHPEYAKSVGSPAYAAPEACCGLSANRGIAPLTDVYALGCMLYELFNLDYFWEQLMLRNTNYPTLTTLLASVVIAEPTMEKKVAAWTKEVNKLSKGVAPVPIDAPGTSVPKGIASQLGNLLHRMTRFDFNQREDSFENIRAAVQSAIKALQNEAEVQRRLQRARFFRQNRIKKLQAREQRLAARKGK